MTTFGQFELEKRLGAGGFAEVFLAKQTHLKGIPAQVALKRILLGHLSDSAIISMFLNEARTIAQCHHPNIAQIHDLGSVDGQPYIVMEFIHGRDLRQLLSAARGASQKLNRQDVLRIVIEVCRGLHHAHTKVGAEGRPLNVVHRDIKPGNIMVSVDGSVKLLDFGIAKVAGQARTTRTGTIKGTCEYMAPEQVLQVPDARSDQFSLGLVLYELLTGTRPFKRDSEAATLVAVAACEIPAPSSVDKDLADLDEVVMRALRREAGERYGDVDQFRRALEPHLASAQVKALMQGLVPPEDARPQPGPAAAAASDGPTWSWCAVAHGRNPDWALHEFSDGIEACRADLRQAGFKQGGEAQHLLDNLFDGVIHTVAGYRLDTSLVSMVFFESTALVCRSGGLKQAGDSQAFLYRGEGLLKVRTQPPNILTSPNVVYFGEIDVQDGDIYLLSGAELARVPERAILHVLDALRANLSQLEKELENAEMAERRNPRSLGHRVMRSCLENAAMELRELAGGAPNFVLIRCDDLGEKAFSFFTYSGLRFATEGSDVDEDPPNFVIVNTRDPDGAA
ncbi:MAG: serine/threonine protein kinase [Deltaproteobacteria bacterium]|nr:serine/threonine protein kinase [Deltaproteobacteria bacterium]